MFEANNSALHQNKQAEAASRKIRQQDHRNTECIKNQPDLKSLKLLSLPLSAVLTYLPRQFELRSQRGQS